VKSAWLQKKGEVKKNLPRSNGGPAKTGGPHHRRRKGKGGLKEIKTKGETKGSRRKWSKKRWVGGSVLLRDGLVKGEECQGKEPKNKGRL